jgi:Putative, 10TM heavy-metal exporter
MNSILLNVVEETLQITLLITLMMITVDAINIWSRGKIASLLKGKKKSRQYVVSSFIGAIPGCFGGFTDVTLYMHGLISFGALTGAMIAASGDEAFVMLAMFPKTAILLFFVLFIIGIFGGRLTDVVVKKFNIVTCSDCPELIVHDTERNFKHFMKEHVLEHIVKKHIWKIAIWTFGALLIVEFGFQYLHIEKITSEYKLLLLLLGAIIGLIPESGPHLIFVTLFANGLIPFSILLTSSIVQDGHGMLPMLSYSIKDSVKLKVFNFAFGISIGLILFLLGF